MVGLPNMRIIDPRFQVVHQTMIRGTMRSTIRVIRLADQQGTRDPAAGRTTFATPYIVHDGPGRIQARGGGATARGPGGAAESVAGRVVAVGSYLVAIPSDTESPVVGDTVKIIQCPDDRSLEGRTLSVVDVPHSDIAWQRNLGCDLIESTPRG